MFAFQEHNLQAKLIARRFATTLTDMLNQLEARGEMISMFLEAYPMLLDDLAENGWTCLDLDQVHQATKIFSFLLQFDSENPGYHAAYADCCSRVKEYALACEHYEMARELAPEIADAYLCLAEHSLMMRQPHEALGHLESLMSNSWFDSAHPLHQEVTKVLGWCQEWMLAA